MAGFIDPAKTPSIMNCSDTEYVGWFNTRPYRKLLPHDATAQDCTGKGDEPRHKTVQETMSNTPAQDREGLCRALRHETGKDIMEKREILFSPPDISQAEIDEVTAALKSGWITTGPRTKQLEQELKVCTGADGFACLNSATAALECGLRALGIGPGDEVIVCAYTYTASISPIIHLGATPILCDTQADSFEMDYDALGALINEHTKAIIPVDLGGHLVNYDRLFEIVRAHAACWTPNTDIQRCFDRVIIFADSAHALGSTQHGKPAGSIADFTSFSFHAVKNFTTAEGGGLAWRSHGFDNDAFYHDIMLQSLHGQSKDALSKNKIGAWEYDIEFPGWKCNMTDVLAALGLAQFKRYPSLLARRRELIEHYERNLADLDVITIPHYHGDNCSSGHLMMVHIKGIDEQTRNEIIVQMATDGVATNVHYKPVPLFTGYQKLGFSIDNYPQAYKMYASEITLPLHTLLTDDDVDYVTDSLKRALAAAGRN